MLSKVVSESGWALAVGTATKADQQRSHKSGRRNVFVFRNGVVKDISSQRSCPDGIFSRVKRSDKKVERITISTVSHLWNLQTAAVVDGIEWESLYQNVCFKIIRIIMLV